MIQLMPGASESVIGRLEDKLKEISSITTLLDVGNTPERILEYILGEFGLEINEMCIRDRHGTAALFMMEIHRTTMCLLRMWTGIPCQTAWSRL